jgi:hypothetical protein
MLARGTASRTCTLGNTACTCAHRYASCKTRWELSVEYLKTKIPVHIHIALVFFALISIGMILIYFDNQASLWDVIGVYSLGFTLNFLALRLNKSYLLGYNEDAVYFRPDGLNWKLQFLPSILVRYEDIELAQGEMGKILNLGIMPFSHISVYGKDGEYMYLSPFSLYHHEMQPLVRKIYEKNPEACAQNVIDYLNSDQVL